MKPSIIVNPHPRTMDEIFDRSTLLELADVAEVVWGKDDPMPEGEFRSALARATAVAFGQWPYPVGILQDAGPDLAAVFEVAGTHDHPLFDYATCFERGIPVGSIAPAFADVVAEMSLALALSAARGVGISDRGFRSADETFLHEGNIGSISLYGKTIGFVGCGAISRSLQSLLEPFRPMLVGYDPWLDASVFADRNIEPVGLEELFTRCHVVFVLAVPTPENRGLVSAELMRLLDRDEVLVVTSRAHVVDFDALTNHLLAGDFRAGIDVFPEEPLPASHPIRNAETAVLTAHLAGALPDALHQIGWMVLDDLKAILGKRTPTNMQYATPEMIASLRKT